jgi:hypothetical protein
MVIDEDTSISEKKPYKYKKKKSRYIKVSIIEYKK